MRDIRRDGERSRTGALPHGGKGCWFNAGFAGAALAALLLAGCASAPRQDAPIGSAPSGGARPGPAPASERDGPDAQPPPDLASVPDAEPRIEPVRAGGPNKPYEVLGREYVPFTEDRSFVERGLASWYGRKFQGRRTSSGELYNMYEMTAAHPTLPIPSYARVRNPANGREVVVRINDRGPFHPGRIVDLSYTAALKLDLLRGVAPVELERITQDEIRSGAWRRDAAPVVATARVAEPQAVAQTGAPVAASASAPASAPAFASARAEPTPIVVAAPSAAARAVEPAAQPVPPVRVADATPPTPPAADAPGRAYTVHAKGYWVQLGAFRERGGAEAFQRRVGSELEWLAPLMAIFNEASVHRLQAGPFANREEAGSASLRIRHALQLVPTIVERR